MSINFELNKKSVPKLINVLIVDDHPLIRRAVNNLLLKNSLILKCDQAENGKVALQKCKENDYDLIFLDIAMPVMDGVTALRYMKQDHPNIKIVILTMFENFYQFIELIELGVNGYLLKTIEDDELNKAIDLIIDDRTYYTPVVYNVWLEYLAAKKDLNSKVLKNQLLSKREIDVIRGICLQLNAKEIGEKYFISENTVNNHRSNIMRKINIHNTVGLVIYAIKNGIFIP